MPRNAKSLAQQALELEQLKAQAKELYARIDTLFEGLAKALEVGEHLKLPDGRVFRITDPFAAADGAIKKVWRHVPVSRYEFEIA